mgnify:FL=1
MRALAPVLAAALLMAGAARADALPPPEILEAEAKWQAEIAEANEAYAAKPTAILKIDDAIYLKPGETAWLLNEGGTYAWSLSAPASAEAPFVTASEDLRHAQLDVPGATVDLLDEGVAPYALSETVRVSAGVAQIEPGKDGMRIAVYNDANPDAAAFTGLDYYPYDPSFVVEAAFQPAAKLEPKVFQTSRGWYKRFYYAGDAVFTLKDVAVRLPMYAGTDDPAELDSLAAFIMDETTGGETYGVGRYIDVEVAKGALPAALTIDFNYLYNPNCARSDHYNCPVAVDKVALPVRAGEKKPAGHS